MRLDERECWRRLAEARSGVLGTVHPSRGVDAVPVVFALVGGAIVVPIDAVKPKTGSRLGRLRNLERDGRCVLLVDHYDDDWRSLWWVRVHGLGTEVPPTGPVLEALAERYPRYATPGAVTSVIVLAPTSLTGWSAAPPTDW